MADEGDDGVVMFSQSTGSPHTAATAADLVDDNLLAIPLSWYSGWADPDMGGNVMELYTSYCLEAMNGVELPGRCRTAPRRSRSSRSRVSTARTAPQGAKKAAEALGLEIVYDGEGAVVPGSDQTPGDHRARRLPTPTSCGRRSTRRRSPRSSAAPMPRACGPSGRATRRRGTTSCWPPTSARSPTRCTRTRPTPQLWESRRQPRHDRDDRGHAGPEARRRPVRRVHRLAGPRATPPSRCSSRPPPTAT